jgi:protein-S-isoprenylcysteine O-methyltransferase Ste14
MPTDVQSLEKPRCVSSTLTNHQIRKRIATHRVETQSAPQIPTSARLVDRAIRVLLATFFVVVTVSQLQHVFAILGSATEREALGLLGFYAKVSAQISTMMFTSLTVVLFLIRHDQRGKAKGFRPRIMAFTGSFIVLIVNFLQPAELSVEMHIIATAIILFGNCLAVYALAWLGRSFSIMAEARKLVTTGPYALIRHPLYFAEGIAFLGVIMQFYSAGAIAILIVQVITQIQRMRNEEDVLRSAYPEYKNYEARTARLIPGVY